MSDETNLARDGAHVLLGAIFAVVMAGALGQCPVEQQAVGVTHACGECDHVGECGDYECRPGVDGWQLKAAVGIDGSCIRVR